MRRITPEVGAGVVALALALLTLAGVTWAYQQRAPWTLAIGEPGDQHFLSGFYGDEADVGYRYRWTTAHATITLRDTGPITTPFYLTLRVQGYRPAPAPTPIITVTVNGAWQIAVPLSSDMNGYGLGPVHGIPATDSLVVTIDSPTFSPPGDARALGVKIDQVGVVPNGPLPFIPPPAGVLAAAVIAVLGLFGLAWRLLAGATARAQLLGALGIGVVGLLLLEGGLVRAGFQTTWVLQSLAGWVGLAGVAAVAWPWLRDWPGRVDGLIASRRVALVLLALVLLAYTLFVLALLPQIDWIGHADYADNAVVARNLAAGRGYVVDYVAQFYKDYPGITHPAETWPILQPTLIAPFFLLFGPVGWAARLPNLLLLLALAGAVYAFGSRWWDRRVGLLAAVFTLCHPYFFQTVIYPINDLAFTLFALLTIGLAWEAVRLGETRLALGVGGGGLGIGDEGSGIRDQGSGWGDQGADVALDQPLSSATSNLKPQTSNLDPQPPTPNPQPPVEAQFTGLDMQLARRRADLARRGRRLAGAAGACSGLLVWSKPTGLVLLGGLVVALWLRGRLIRWAGRRPEAPHKPLPADEDGKPQAASRIPQWLWAVGAFALVLAPLLARNLLTFGTPFYSTESFDVWILRYWNGDPQIWERIYALYTGPDRRPPYAGLLLGGSFDQLWLAVTSGFQNIWQAAFLKGEVLPLPLALGALAGWLLAPRRLYGLLGAAAAGFGALTLLVLLYWHYEARYFLALVPWAYLGLAAGLFWAWDQARARRPADAVPYAPGRWAQALLPVAVALVLGPALTNIGEQAASVQGPDTFAEAGRWLAAHTPPDAVVMSRDPWELNWYSGRKVVMIPWGPLADIQSVARQYGVGYLWVGGPSWRFRRDQVEPLLPSLAVTPVYTSTDGAIRIYQWKP